MPAPPRTASFDLSLELLRRDHLPKYRRWVRVGVVASMLGYTASVVTFTLKWSWAAALASGDPFVVLADLIALALLLCGFPRAAAALALAAVFVDAHFSLLVLPMPTLANVGLIMPAFVLASGILFGGRFALAAAGVLVFSVPATLWCAGRAHPGRGFDDPAVLHYLVVIEAALAGTTALVVTLLRTSAEILEQHRAGEARSRTLQAQLQHAQKLEALGRLAGGVAHDFNNLLAAIGGYGVLLGRSSDPRARELGSEIVAAQHRGASLTKQLLAFARKDTAQPRPIDLSRSLAALKALLLRAVGDRVQLHVEAEPGCAIVADPGRIEQVLLNLAVNARDAMPDGGRLWIRCSASEGQVQLEVEDEGTGMDEQVQARAFEPFFTTKGRDHGTGLGLSTVHGIVTDSGGSIDLQSRVGQGTRFTVRWARVGLVPEAESAPQIELAGGDRSVLLVEDNAGARSYFHALLAERGFRVTAAGSAEEAVALTDGTLPAPDLVLTDVVLPGRTGPELVAQLRARWPALPCLFVSGYLGDIALGDGFDPATDLVPKPFTPSELLARIASKLATPDAEREPSARTFSS
jgi:signal transduction histidine kinase/ActR/RegA family two-component response regulator